MGTRSIQFLPNLNRNTIILLWLISILHKVRTYSLPIDEDLFNLTILMPKVNTTKNDQYVYHQYEFSDEELAIVGCTGISFSNTAHHLLIFACTRPKSNQIIWNVGPECSPQGQHAIIYDWSKEGAPIIFPNNVGFSVGRNTSFKYIVINMHYLSPVSNDQSGIQLLMSRQRRRYQMRTMLCGTNEIHLNPKSYGIRIHFSCFYNSVPISIFAAQVHTHQLGRVNSLYRVRNGNISNVYKGDPQWPQSFYFLKKPIDIQAGDFLIGQCVYDNDGDHIVTIGTTHTDEMCNVYAMYSFESRTDESGTINTALTPILNCWNNKFSNLTSLIPPESDVPPTPLGKTEISIEDGQYGEYSLTTNHVMVPSYHADSGTEPLIDLWSDLEVSWKNIGDISGIALMNTNDELVVLHRGSRKQQTLNFTNCSHFDEFFPSIIEDVILHLDVQTGKIRKQWGANMFYMPQGLTIDHEGNYWLTDIVMHQVLMFKDNDLAHPALEVGTKFQAGAGSTQLCQPANVQVMKNGDFFVADGYCNHRIVKFNRQGKYITQWDWDYDAIQNSNFVQICQWDFLHSFALNEEAKMLCSSSQRNFDIICFNISKGKLLQKLSGNQQGILSAIPGFVFLSNIKNTVSVVIMDNGTSMKQFNLIDLIDGRVLISFESQSPLVVLRALAVSYDGSIIYVAGSTVTNANIIQKFIISIANISVTQTYNKSRHLREHYRAIILSIVAFVVIFTLIVAIAQCIRIIRKSCIYRYNGVSIHNSNAHDYQTGSILSSWLKQRKRLEQSEHCLNEENVPLNYHQDDDFNDQTNIIEIVHQRAEE